MSRIDCVRSSIKDTTVFLKRSPKDIRVNAYMKNLLSAWSANHDIQFVHDAYACAVYIASYISKSQKGMSALLDNATKEAKRGNMDIRKCVRHIGNVFLNSVEVCAQEAIYLVLQMPLTKATREVLFISTSPETERTFLLKDKAALEDLDENSTDIAVSNLLTRYAKRPKALNTWCLAEFASELNIIYDKTTDKKKETNDTVNDDNAENESDFDEEENIDSLTSSVICRLPNGIVYKKRKRSKVIRYVRYNKKTDPENYYREQLMLFHPWRNETVDLLNTHGTYEDHYLSIKSELVAVAAKYDNHCGILDEVQDKSDNLNAEFEDAYDRIAPSAQETEAHDQEIGCSDNNSFAFFDPSQCIGAAQAYDIGIDLGLAPVSLDVNVDILPTRIPEEEYLKLIRSLNDRQREFFLHVIHAVKSENSPLRLFLTGGAGVGKSVVVRVLHQALLRILCSKEGEDPNDTKILLCAPTGKAAYNIRGTTLHAAFKIPASEGFDSRALGPDQLNTLQVQYKNLSVLIIDEISMVGSGMFNLINLRLQQIKGNKKLFGGIHVITFGDLFQLKPVFDGWIFTSRNPLATNLWVEEFSMYELREIMRQKDDQHFAELLNRLIEGNETDDDITVLKQRKTTQYAPGYPKNAPHLFSLNAKVKEYNNIAYNLVPLENKVEINSYDSVGGDVHQAVKTKTMRMLDNLESTKTCGLERKLNAGIGLRYEVAINVSVMDGLTNGAGGVLQMIDYRQPSNPRPSILWIKFDDMRIGFEQRRKYKSLYHVNIDKDWTPIFDIKRSFPMQTYRKNVNVTRIQFPLRQAGAKSVHKSQGETLNEAVISIITNRKWEHIHYVAFSRVTSLSQLHILELNEDKIYVSSAVKAEMTRLRSDQQVQLSFKPVYSYPPETLKLLFHNTRSLHRHYDDIVVDRNFHACDMICFAETRLVISDNTEDYTLRDFVAFRNDQERDGNSASRPSHGLLSLAKNTVQILDFEHFSSFDVEFSVFYISTETELVQVVFLYRSPSSSVASLKSHLTMNLLPLVDLTQSLVIMGDFNVNVCDDNNKAFVDFMKQQFKCHQRITKPTTDKQSILDLIFTNIDNVEVGVTECPWSDHNGIYMCI